MKQIRKIIHPQKNDFTQSFFNEINQSIGIEDDKDTFEDFIQILNSSDEQCEFAFYALESNGQLASGAMVCNIALEKCSAVVIIYLFTNRNFRSQGLGTKVIQTIAHEHQKSFFLAEVLDHAKTDPEQEALESSYSGLDTNNRESFWTKNQFQKMQFDYHNPSPDIENHCNRKINYNSLWVNNVHQLEVKNETVLEVLRIYFQYGYSANQMKGFDIEAYKRNADQLNP